jgi:serine/threonine-protein kinase
MKPIPEGLLGGPEGSGAADKPAVKPGPRAGEKPFQPPKHLAPGTLVDKKYAVLRVLGEGGMGVVYLARDIHTGLDVVVKAVRSELAHRDDVRARTLAEGRALAQIDHPNVVHLRAVAVEGLNLFLVMQYIEGESLDKLILRYTERGERMPVEEALGIFRQVAAGVGAAHEEGVVHRDLKPANVLLRRKDRVAKVTDFGIALVQSDTTRPHTRGILGSLWYMSPEQVTGRRDLDHRVDVYALGILLYQMLVGHVPFDAKSDYEIMKQHAESPMPFAAATRPDLPPAVDELIQRACAKDRAQRFQSCEELVGAVDRLLGYGHPPTVPGVTGPGLTPPLPMLAPRLSQAPALVATGDASVPIFTPPPPLATSRPGDATGVGGDAVPVAPPARRVWPWVALALVLVGGIGGTAAVLALGLVPGLSVSGLGDKPRGAGSADAGARAAASGRPASSAVGTTPKADPALEALAGNWVGNGRELEAVLVGADLEFRVKKPEQLARQNYEVGEARFVLHATGDAGVFAVEDRIRPVPPVGKTYDARARGTCQEVWTSVGGDPLRAHVEGPRLTVEFAKIEPAPANFTTEGARVTSCVALRDLKASKVVSVLTRQ